MNVFVGNPNDKLIELCSTLLNNKRLFMASNRGPIEYRANKDGRLQGQRGSGGVVTALSSVSEYLELTWFASAMGEGDRLFADNSHNEPVNIPLIGPKLFLQFIVSSRSVYHKYYNIFCNPLLWFLQHYMWNFPYTPNIDAKVYDAWQNGYVLVNKAFADAMIKEAKKDSLPPIILSHDYHLYLLGGYIRNQIPEATLMHFNHIPWPAPSYWQLLPPHMREAILTGLCANDIVGLQTMRDIPFFLYSCKEILENSEVDFTNHTITINNHTTKVKSYPISVDVPNLKKLSQSPRIHDYIRKLSPLLGEKTIIRVDRTEPSKNIIRGFRAFDILLNRYPELIGKVKFLAFLVPSRTHIKQYQRYNQEVLELIEMINNKYGTDSWQPIKVFYENNYLQAIAAMHLYDVLLVNAVIDGMNLVAKEGPIVNTRDGVLVLSETVGAHEQLKSGALSITPVDMEITAEMLHTALTMSTEERKRRSDILKASIKREDLSDWLYKQLYDINLLINHQAI